MERYKCCLCKKEFEGYGNNPDGFLDINYKLIKWESNDRCCNDCNRLVIRDRVITEYLIKKRKDSR